MIGLVAKAIAALLGGVSVWGATAAPHGIDTAELFGLLAVVGTAVAVFAVPNRPVEGPGDEGLTLVEFLVGGLVLILLFAVIVGAR